MIWNNLYLLHDLNDDVIANAVATSFGVPRAQVMVDAADSRLPVPANAILVVRDDFRKHEPDTIFPVALSIFPPDRLAILPEDDAKRLATIARGLDVPFMASIDTDDQDTMRLVMPTGELLERQVEDVDLRFEAGDLDRLASYHVPHLLPIAS
ncbi:MAG: hypothetical protein ACR2OU_13260 [Thermomicrobiales bacterium]